MAHERERAKRQADSPSEVNYASLLEAQRSVALHFTNLAHTEIRQRSEVVFAEGDKNGKLLANLAADCKTPVCVPVVRNKGGFLVTDPKEILEEFVQFYSTLYSPIPPYNPLELEELLRSLSMPKLSDTDMAALDEPISALEIEAAMLSFPPQKAPGPDGFPADFYRAFRSRLAPRLNVLFRHCWEHGALPASMMEAYMVLLLKPGKDPLECSSYRPIALLNADLKILAKVLASRLAGVISTLVDIDQTGFIPGMSTDTNLRRLFTHLQIDATDAPAKVIVTIDIEKAFDSVDWDYMHRVLEVMGFGPGFRRITMLYGDPRTAIRLGATVSEFFPLGRGTRQGCPLSPFIFALMMEPIARALRQSNGVGGIQVGSIRECVALYADDLILFLRDPGPSLKSALQIMNQFASYSGLRVNWGKSSVLPLGPEAQSLRDNELPLQWVTSITYLGVRVTAEINDYMTLNLLPLVSSLKQKTQVWRKLPLSLIGRISLIKMKFLPVILYFLRHSPVWIPKHFFTTLNGIVGSFLWSPQSPRISIAVLQEPLGQGGLALPDWQKYYMAGQMVFARRWLLADEGDAATVLEAAHLGSYESLRLALYRGPRSSLPLTVSMKATVRAWGATTLLMSPSYTGVSPSAPLWLNPNLPDFCSLPDPMIWACRGVKLLEDVTREGELISFDQLKDRHDLPNSFFFRYLQLRHAFQAQFDGRRIELLPSALETLLKDEDLIKPLSTVYKSLFTKSPLGVIRCRERWGREIPGIQGEEWEKMWDHPFRHLVSARDRLIQFKFLHRVYLTPARLTRIYPSSSGQCWRCPHTPADSEHIFWTCPLVQVFWAGVVGCLSEVLGVPVPLSPRVCLLGLVEEVVPSLALRTLLNIGLFYGRKAILLKWKNPGAPTISFWKGLVNSVIHLYKATYKTRGCAKKFMKIWRAWLDSSATVG